MKQTARRQFLLLGCAALAAMSLSMYDRYGNIFQNVREALVQETEDEEQRLLKQHAVEENEQAKAKSDTTQGTEAAENSVDRARDASGDRQNSMQGKDSASEVDTDNPEIRVLICSDNYQSEYHDSVTIRATVPWTLSYGNVTESYNAGDTLCLDMQSVCLSDGKAVLILEEEGVFQLPLLQRNQVCPSYEGTLTVEKRENGLLVVNTLPLETYLCYVVPSEMPSSYPIEALKAQAVCARCYALRQLGSERCAEFGADLDDSVSYQVYNNIGKTEKAVQAVQETAGLVMKENGEIENALYYSTSCGIRMGDDLSEEAVFCSFMTGSGDDHYEKEEPWYRWHVTYPLELLNTLAEAAYPGQIGNVGDMAVLSRADNGRAQTLQISGDLGSVCVEGEYAIRKFLQTSGTEVILQDDSTAPQLGLLPSAFFYVTPQYENGVLTGFLLNGGGYGHGNGMSQNGARHMAQDGKSCTEILQYYYGDGVEVVCAT